MGDETHNLKIEMTDGVLLPEKGENSIFSAWKLAFFGALIILLMLILVSESNIRVVKLYLSALIGKEIRGDSLEKISNKRFEKIVGKTKRKVEKEFLLSFYTLNNNFYEIKENILFNDKLNLFNMIQDNTRIYHLELIDRSYFIKNVIKKTDNEELQKKLLNYYDVDSERNLLTFKKNISESDKLFFYKKVYRILYINPYAEVVKFVPDGVFTTLYVTVFSILFASLIGLFVGIGRMSRIKTVNRMVTIYVEIIRGIPLLVQLFYIYYALAKFVSINDIVAAVIAMSICYGAYIGEIFRAGIQSINKGQMEAALSLGMTRSQAIRYIILPQTFKVVLPPIGNEFIALLKDSSLVSILAVSDLLRRGREYASKSFYYFETFTMVALIYLILTLFFSRLVGMMEEKLKKNG